MTAPGNSALVISLMAVFVACAAYAIGRLHQRRQMDGDREDAYREGYDNATRRTFSLAAHLVARRRTARPAADPLAEGPVPTESEPISARPTPSPRPATPRPAVPAQPDPASSDPPSSDASAASPPVTTSPGSGALLRRSAVPGSSPRPPARHSSPPTEYNATSLGFPVPPPAPPRIIGEPAAFGGVVYRPFPDPRLAGDSEPLPADRGSLHGVPSPRSHPSVPVLPEPTTGAEPSPTSAAPTGRHTAPDELVHSATYRLPADRVFRAKVPEPADRPALPEEPTTRIWLPKPRQS